jgi:hypothetical protein
LKALSVFIPSVKKLCKQLCGGTKLHTELEDYWIAFGSSDECVYCYQVCEEIDTDVKPLGHAFHLKNTFKISSRTSHTTRRVFVTNSHFLIVFGQQSWLIAGITRNPLTLLCYKNTECISVKAGGAVRRDDDL